MAVMLMQDGGLVTVCREHQTIVRKCMAMPDGGVGCR